MKRNYDILTIVGMIGGLVLLTAAIIVAGTVAGAKAFFSISSIITVVGGLIASLLINFNLNEIKKTIYSVKRAFIQEEQDMALLVDEFVELSTLARREGLLSLDNQLEEIKDPFIQKGILLTVDGLEAEVIKEILNAEIQAIEEEQKIGKNVIAKAGELAPAWGMIGTLIGLILMLQNLEDPKTLGPSMALALITTFYGAVLANLFFIPLSGKIGNRTEYEVYIKQIMIEGILGVQSGQNPKLLRDKLEVFVEKETKKEAKEETGKVEDEASSTVNEEVAY